MSFMQEIARVGESAALEAGRLLLGKYRSNLAVSRKGAIDLVTEADLASEELIVSRIREFFPDHAVHAEESHSGGEHGRYTWIIDPLDGTTNYAHGFPVFAISIALELDGDLAWGVVRHPLLDETFTARRGGGAWLNGERIAVSTIPSLDDSLLATGFPYDIRTSRETNLDEFRAFALRCRGIRRAGSAALDFAYVAAGRLDGFWEPKLKPWDCAAGYLLVREAGGRVSDYEGRAGTIFDDRVVASNGLIHDEMLRVLGKAEDSSQ